MEHATVRVSITIDQQNTIWTVPLYLVWLSNDTARTFTSREKFTSEQSAIDEIKRRAMQYILESGRSLAEDQVKWEFRPPAP
jgi:hypothetical protein